jgi:hypothetical protein
VTAINAETRDTAPDMNHDHESRCRFHVIPVKTRTQILCVIIISDIVIDMTSHAVNTYQELIKAQLNQSAICC